MFLCLKLKAKHCFLGDLIVSVLMTSPSLHDNWTRNKLLHFEKLSNHLVQINFPRNLISTKGCRLCPPNNAGTTGFSDLPTALGYKHCVENRHETLTLWPKAWRCLRDITRCSGSAWSSGTAVVMTRSCSLTFNKIIDFPVFQLINEWLSKLMANHCKAVSSAKWFNAPKLFSGLK